MKDLFHGPVTCANSFCIDVSVNDHSLTSQLVSMVHCGSLLVPTAVVAEESRKTPRCSFIAAILLVFGCWLYMNFKA